MRAMWPKIRWIVKLQWRGRTWRIRTTVRRDDDDDDDDDNVKNSPCYDVDLDVLETMSLHRLRENKQFLKIAAKCDKDLDLLRRKHDKVNEARESEWLRCHVCRRLCARNASTSVITTRNLTEESTILARLNFYCTCLYVQFFVRMITKFCRYF